MNKKISKLTADTISAIERNLEIENKQARQTLSKCKRIVIKIGTSSLTNNQGRLNTEQVEKFTKAIAQLQHLHKKEIILVTSGAIGAGVGALGFNKRPTALAHLQMAAAIGQSRLMSVYSDLFEKEDILCAQILLTHEDLRNRMRHINAVNTFEALISHKAIPIINENDVVAVDEIKVGDNDTLAAMVAIMCKADLLVLLTTTDGLRSSNLKEAPRLPYIRQITNKIIALAQGKTNQFSTGGMHTKLLACRKAALVGIPSLILDSSDALNTSRAIAGLDIGTLIGIPKSEKKLHSKKRYVGFFTESKGILYLDQGASNKLKKGLSSLLAVGITKVSGNFRPGCVVEIRTADGQELGRGFTPFSSSEIRRIQGKRSVDIAKLNAKLANKPVIHHDHLTLL